MVFLKIKSKGFTLIETVFVTAILLVLTLIALATLFSIREKSNLDKEAQTLLNVLRLARNKTIASEGAARYGVHFISDDPFSADKYILFKEIRGTSDDIIFELSKPVEFQRINLTSDDVIFKKITGEVIIGTGDIKLGLIADPSQTATIYIDASGKIDFVTTSLPSPPRPPLKDSRHVHFELGWSIQDATSLKFYFPTKANPTQTEIVDMANYFNADKSAFDWRGSFTVGGTEQKFRVHTHLLNPAQPPYTILSITRDRNNNKNDKSVEIYIVHQRNEKQIASYDNTGNVEKGSYVNKMEIQ